MYSTDAYAGFSSAERAESNVICDTLHDLDTALFNFDAFGSGLQVEQPDATHGDGSLDDVTPGQEVVSGSPFYGATQSSLLQSELQTPPLLTPDDSQLSLPSGMENQSLMTYLSPPPAFDSPLSSSASNVSTPMHLDQSDVPSNDFNGNALGLFDNAYMVNGSIQDLSYLLASFAMTIGTGGSGEQLVPTANLSLIDNSLCPLIDATAQLSLGTGLPSPPHEGANIEVIDTVMPSVDVVATCEPKALCCTPPLDASMLVPEQAYPSPSPTPLKTMKRLPSVAVSNAKARRALPARAAAANRKSYREYSASPTPESPALSPSRSVYDIDNAQVDAGAPANAVDKCEYGYRVWEADCRGRRTAKWECQFCHTRVGRRPDLHRHYKTCVTKEKFYCKDVIHADGSVWIGCGMTFSRRDACHRHLKKRFTEGRCIKKKPREEPARTAEEYARRMCLYEEMLDNYKWRAALPAAEKNRLVNTALTQIKKDMF